MKVNIFVLVTVLLSGFTNGQFNQFSFEQDNDIWEDNIIDSQYEEESHEASLQTLCNHYDIQYKNEIIKCDQIKFLPKVLAINEHILSRRDVDAEEGSGEEPTIAEEETKTDDKVPDSPVDELEKNPSGEEEKPTDPQEETKEKPEENVQPPAEDDIPDVQPLEVTSAATEPKVEVKVDETSKPQEQESETTPKIEVKNEISESESKGVESEAKKGRKEEVNSEQSGIALLNSGGNMIESDKKVGRMKPKESIQATDGLSVEEAKTGQASETPSRKDNKLLISLFVVVVALGVVAFAYRFIQKRKHRNVTRTEQNGTSKTSDPEEGREMKPLMKTGEQPKAASVEYDDEK